MDPVLALQGLVAGLAMFSVYAIVASFIVESALDLLFGWKIYQRFLGGKGLKVPVSFACSLAACKLGGIDPFAMAAADPTKVTIFGLVMAAALVAGGSKKLAKQLGTLKETIEEVKQQ